MADTQTITNDSSLSDSLGFDINKLPGFLKQEATAKKAASTADIQAKALEESVGLEEKRKALENISAEDKAHYEDVKKQMMPEPQFKPTKDNAADIGALFSMIATMGVALGGSGKLSGLNAMNAMGGMLKGYQQGRKDLFTKEQATFDKELASMKAHNDELIKDLEQYNKLRVTDKESALVKAGEITAKYPGVIAAKINAGDTKVVSDIAHSNSEMLIKMEEARTRLGLAGKGSQAGQVQFRYNSVVTNSIDQLAIAIDYMQTFKNAQLPPELGNALTNSANGIPTAVESLAARAMTDDEARLFQQSAAGVKLAMTNVEASGLPRGASQAASSEYGKMEVKGGDPVISKAMYFALIKQVANLGVRDLQTSGGTPEQIVRAQQKAEEINKLVPYTVKDVITAAAQSTNLNDDQKLKLANQVQGMNNYLSILKQQLSKDTQSNNVEGGSDDHGKFHWEYSPDGAYKRKVYE